MCYAKKHLKRKDRRFWNIHGSWGGGKIRSYLINEFELEGFEKKLGFAMMVGLKFRSQ